MKKVIFLNAGHSLADPGAITSYGKESDFNRNIRDSLVPKLERCGFQVKKAPDIFDLKNSIYWVNERAKGLNDGLAFSIHCNCCNGVGAETFYYKHNESSKKIAKALIDEYCKEMGMINRGAKSDYQSRWGELGWIRKTNCWATLIECGFMNNKSDVEKMRDFNKTATAIAKGICKIFGVKYVENSSQSREKIKKQIIELVKQL